MKDRDYRLAKFGLAAFCVVTMWLWYRGLVFDISLLNPFDVAFYGSGALLLGTMLRRFHPHPYLLFVAAAFCVNRLASIFLPIILFKLGAINWAFHIELYPSIFLMGMLIIWAWQAATGNAPRLSDNNFEADSYEGRMVRIGLVACAALVAVKLLRGEELMTGAFTAFFTQYAHYDTYNASTKMLALAWCITDMLAYLGAGYLLMLRTGGVEETDKPTPWVDVAVLAILGRWVVFLAVPILGIFAQRAKTGYSRLGGLA
jgi:hypothetical protein